MSILCEWRLQQPVRKRTRYKNKAPPLRSGNSVNVIDVEELNE